MKLLNFNRVLCLSPHPDDVELAMLGTILEYKDTIFDILCLSRSGAKGFDATAEVNRRREIEELWENSGSSNVGILFSDVEYFEDKIESEWIYYIENTFIKRTTYNCIFTPSKQDSMFEHKFVNRFGYALIRHLPMSLIEYHTISTLNTWAPNLFIDVEKHYLKKIDLLGYFTSQLKRVYFKEDIIRSKHINVQCAKKGIKKVEQYKIKEIII